MRLFTSKKSFEIRIVGNNIDNYQAGDVVILGSGFPHYHVVGENKKESGNYIETIAMFFPQSIIESNSKFLEFAQINSTLEKLKYGIKLKKQTKKRSKTIGTNEYQSNSRELLLALFNSRNTSCT